MGSRRSYTLSAVVGKGSDVSAGKGAVTKAIKAGNTEQLVASSAELVAKSQRTGEFFFYGLKLLDALRRLAPGAGKLTAQELDRQIRVAWADVKRVNKIRDDDALDKIVVDAAKQTLRVRGR
jgi:hypothetical protein